MSHFLDWLSHGSWQLSILGLVIFTLAVTHVTIVAVTVYLHRHSAHRSVDLHPLLQHFLRFWLWMTTGMITKEWTAIHRKHHAACETESDPHSPRIKGLGKILWQGAEVYREACENPEILARYGAGCPDDWVERNVYSRFQYLGVSLMLVIDVAVFGALGVTAWAVQMLWIPVLGAGVINGIGHYWGYRNFECPDAATNIVPWGILIGGEELHNNHHTYPNSAKLSQKPWEFDVGWFWIRVFQGLGLAKPRSRGPIAERIPGKSTLDFDTARAVINDRFRIMARYTQMVVMPLMDEEYHRADAATRRLLKKTRSILCREQSLVDAAGRSHIKRTLAVSRDLKLTYDLRLRLQEVWTSKGAGADEILNALKQWCANAESTGIQALEEFVAELKSYAIPRPATV